MNTKEQALYALFRGRMNIPAAAKHCGIEPERMKDYFKEYAANTPPEDWELDIVLCWPYA